MIAIVKKKKKSFIEQTKGLSEPLTKGLSAFK